MLVTGRAAYSAKSSAKGDESQQGYEDQGGSALPGRGGLIDD